MPYVCGQMRKEVDMMKKFHSLRHHTAVSCREYLAQDIIPGHDCVYVNYK